MTYAPTPTAMQATMAIPNNYADDVRIVFNAKKSKCIHIGPRPKLPYDLPEEIWLLNLYINGHIWVTLFPLRVAIKLTS